MIPIPVTIILVQIRTCALISYESIHGYSPFKFNVSMLIIKICFQYGKLFLNDFPICGGITNYLNKR